VGIIFPIVDIKVQELPNHQITIDKYKYKVIKIVYKDKNKSDDSDHWQRKVFLVAI